MKKAPTFVCKVRWERVRSLVKFPEQELLKNATILLGTPSPTLKLLLFLPPRILQKLLAIGVPALF
jgi:hypothetical protein